MLGNETKTLGKQIFALNVPLSLATDQPNNATMRRLSPEQRRVDLKEALSQWHTLYSHLASKGIVYLVPSRPGLQDLPYVANLGAILHHRDNVAVVSNFRSEPRVEEAAVGLEFFASLGFETVLAPKYFEGEADFKYLRENIYFGAHGLRTSPEALAWFRDEHDANVVPIHVYDESLYHLDCLVFPISPERVILCADVVDEPTRRQVERVAEIIPIDYDLANRGLTNVVWCGQEILCDSPIETLSRDDALYDVESRKVATLERIAGDNGLGVRIFHMSEFYKSGAMLSCMVMNLNHPLAMKAAAEVADTAAGKRAA